jgi:hypothetical protein
VQGLVKGAACCVPALGEHVDRDVVERDCDQYGPLMGCQDLGNRVADGVDQLRGLRLTRRGNSPVAEQLRRAIGFQRELAPVPWAPAYLHSGFEKSELVRPGGETALTAVGVQLRQDRHEGVVGCLHGEVVHADRSDHASLPFSAADLEVGRAQEQPMEVLDCAVALAAAHG